MRPKILDGFCGPGGAGKGYADAGFEVVGVDLRPQKNYPFKFIQADWFEYMRDHWREYDAFHVSPPCPYYARVTKWKRKNWDGDNTKHPALIEPARDVLLKTGKPHVIENVMDAPLINPIVLCGTGFGLNVRRHRQFETNWAGMVLVPACHHNGELPFEHKNERAYADAMGCTWMNKTEARQAIPPAFTKFLGSHLLDYLARDPRSGAEKVSE